MVRIALALALSLAVHAPARGESARPAASMLTGYVVDVESGEPIGWATVALVELTRAERSHRDGEFHFRGVPSGHYTLRVSHLGYQTVELPIVLPADDSAFVVVRMQSTALAGQTVVVTSERERSATPYRPSEVLAGDRLQQQLGRTIAETIALEPGVSQRTMGPAAARPVVRGLGGDRLQLLEDGASSGDMSSTSADHAVAIDPLNAERIEIVQGPASLLFTSNALGGVVNLVRHRIANTHPDRVHGIASLQAESVNAGYTGGIAASLPLGPLALQLDASARRAGNIRTGAGTLDNTDYDAYNGSLGLSHFMSWGYAGAAAGALRTEYGIPGGIAGAHEHGVRVDMQREFIDAEMEALPDSSVLRRVALRGSYSRYQHGEREEDGVIGTEYGLLSGELAALAHHGAVGPFEHGSIGLQYLGRNLVANGVSIPPTTEVGLAAFAYEELELARLTFRGALRLDYRDLAPQRRDARSFLGVSASLATSYRTSPNMDIVATVMRSYRTPTIDELFSQGPHLASYTYEIGYPELGAERGLGLELAARYAEDRGNFSVAVFRNDIAGYVYPRSTGDTIARLRLPVYQQTGAHVVMQGFELAAEWELVDGCVAAGSLGYVHAELVDEAMPLPLIPPLAGRASLRYALPWITFGASVRAADDQTRVALREEPTQGYVLVDAFAQSQFVWGSFLHTIVLSIDNAANTEYRSHLSRTKSIMPEPGRNARVLYRLYF